MKAVKVSENKYRKYNLIDWVRGNFYQIGCAMLIVGVVTVTILIYQAIKGQFGMYQTLGGKMKTVDDVISEIEKNNREIERCLYHNQKLAQELRNRPTDDWDWVSVTTACKIWNISQAMMYRKINSGKIQFRKFENKTYVSLKEVLDIDDKVVNG